MFHYCEVSDITVKRKLNFLQRFDRYDSIVCLACDKYLVRDLSLSGHICGSFCLTF